MDPKMVFRSDVSMVEETGPESSEEYYHDLELVCSQDAFWSHNGDTVPDHPPRCPHCRHWIGSSDPGQHVQHVLNGCKTFLQQGRYDWRHDAVLNYISSCMKTGDPDGLRWHCDLPGKRTHDGGTVPDQLVLTELRPDICILDQRKERPSVILVEITITWDGRLDAARQEKNVKYAELMAKISRQFPVQFVSLEVGSYRQKLSDASRWSLKTLYNFTAQKVPFEVFEENILRLTELCSFKIFAERLTSNWDANTPFPTPPSYVPPKLCILDQDADVTKPILSNFPLQRPLPDLTKESHEKDEPDTPENFLNFGPSHHPDLLESTESGLCESEPETQPETESNSDPEFYQNPSLGFSHIPRTHPDFYQKKEPEFYQKKEPEFYQKKEPEFYQKAEPELVSPPEPDTKPDQDSTKDIKPDPSEDPEPKFHNDETQSLSEPFVQTPISIFGLFCVLLIFLLMILILYTVWNNLHIFMPIFILLFGVSKIWGKT